ncbi:MAG: GNAT family N-acetyltransferase [Candidatus Freyarchaeum deiterrae]
MPERGEYPKQFETVLKLRDGTEVFVRPLKIEDRDKLYQLYVSLSKQTNYERFFSRTHITMEMVEKWSDVNYIDSMALIAIANEDGDEKIVADSRFYLDKNTGEAEGAIVILDTWQERGVGTKLIEYGLEVAKKMGVKKLRADIAPDNRRIIHVMKKLGFQVKWIPDIGGYEINLTLE